MSEKSNIHCGPCSREGTLVSSTTKFCVNCNETLCEVCMKQHLKFTATKNHTFVSGQPRSGRASSRAGSSEGSLVCCSKHAGKVLDSYCIIHNNVCCSVCIAVDHSLCRRQVDSGIVSIENIASNITDTNEFTKTCSSIESVAEEVEVLKNKREENLRRLSEKKNEIVKTINGVREKIDARLKELERLTLAELGEVYVNTAIQAEIDIDLCNDVIASLQSSPLLFLQESSLSNSDLFIHMKKAEQQLTDGKKIIESVSENLGKEVLDFKVDTSIEKQFNTLHSLGRFQLAQHSYKGTPVGEYKICTKFDLSEKQDVQGCCVLTDGRLAIVQGTGRKLKILDTKYNISEQLDLPGKPFGMCVVARKELIVSLKDAKFLQFINVSGKSKLGKVIKVGVECYGIAFHGGDIFVACGGGVYEAKPQLRVYNTDGVLTRIIEKGADGKQIFSTPRNIALNEEGTVIFISDMDRGIVTFDVKKSVISGFWHRGLKSPRGIAVDGNGDILVCGHHSHNVMQFTAAGKVVCTILTEEDGISFPLSICLALPKLIVSSEKSRFLQVYALS